MLDSKPQFDCPIDRAPLGVWWRRKNVGHSQGIRLAERTTLVETMGEDDTAVQMTITCQIRSADPSSPPEALPSVVGRLRWGNGGTTTTAEFDFVNGTVIAVAAGAVSLIAELEDQTIDTEVIPVAHIGYLPHAGLNAVRTPRILNPLLPQESHLVVIPPFARAVVIQRAPQDAIRADIQDAVGNPISQFVGAAAAPRLLIPQDGRRLQFFNDSAVDDVIFRPVFELYI